MPVMMEGRYQHLSQLLAGYKLTGIPLIEHNGIQLMPYHCTDDLGMYCLIPPLAAHMGITIDQAIQLFFNVMTYGALALSLIGFFILYQDTVQRLIAVIALLGLTGVMVAQGMDVYRAYYAVSIATIPWILLMLQKKRSFSQILIIVLSTGLLCGFCHYIRAHSGTAIMLFTLILISTHTLLSRQHKICLVLALASGYIVPMLYFNSVYHDYRTYAEQHLSDFRVDSGCHNFWHPIYLGFGFLENDLGITFDDSVADKKVQSIAPNTPYPSAQGEAILKHEVFNLIKRQKYFTIFTIWAKIGVLLLLFLLFANIGIIAAYMYPKGWRIELAFIAALAFNSLFGVLIIPYLTYCIGFISCATLYGIVSINHALQQGCINQLRKIVTWH